MTGGSGTNTFNIKSTGLQRIFDLKGSDVFTTTAGVNNVLNTVTADYTTTSATINRSTAVDNVKLTSNAAKVDIDMSGATSTVTGFWLLGNNGGDEKLIGSNQADSIDGSGGNDTVSGGAGADTLSGGAGADSIVAGEGADSIFGGLGIDTITLTETAAAADEVVLDGGLTADSITGFAVANDQIDFDLSGFIANGATVALVDIDNFSVLAIAADVAASTAVVVQTISADNTAAAASANVFLLHSGAVTYADADAATAAVEAAGDFSLTVGAQEIDHSFFLAYEKTGGGINLAVANFNVEQAAAVIVDNTLEFADLGTLAGVNDITTLTAANFDFI
jgi:Ca2+-binding RTX toxin-like protein